MRIKFLIFAFITTTVLKAQTTQFRKELSGGYNNYWLENAFCFDNFIFGVNSDEYLLSTDYGKSWETHSGNGIFYPSSQNITLRISQVEIYNNNIIAIVGGRFFISKDFGKNFQRVNFEKGLEDNGESCLNCKPYSNSSYFSDGKYFSLSINSFNLFMEATKLNWSLDCKKWYSINLPEEKMKIVKYFIVKEKIILLTKEDIYISNDFGKTWNKTNFNYPGKGVVADEPHIEFSLCTSDFLFLIYRNNIDKNFLLSLKDFKVTPIKRTLSDGSRICDADFYNDTLFFITTNGNKNGKMYYFADSVSEYNLDTKNLELENIRFESMNVISNSSNNQFHVQKNYFVFNNYFLVQRNNASVNFANTNSQSNNIKNNSVITSETDNQTKKYSIESYCNNNLAPSTKLTFKSIRTILPSSDSYLTIASSISSRVVSSNIQDCTRGQFFIETKKNGTYYDKYSSRLIETRVLDNLPSPFGKFNQNNMSLQESCSMYSVIKNSTYNTICKLEYLGNGKFSTATFDQYLQFEHENNNNIETFKIIGDVVVGNLGEFAFIAESKYDQKLYIFARNMYDKSITKIDFLNLNPSLKKNGFDGYLNSSSKNKITASAYYITNVIVNAKFTYIFLAFAHGFNGMSEEFNFCLPIRITNETKKIELLNIEVHSGDDNRIEQVISTKNIDNVYYLPSSNGFVNAYSKRNISASINESYINYFDSKFNPKKQILLPIKDEMTVLHVNEFNDYIIVGGFTKNEGYLSYPNPEILVYNKNTGQLTYRKVFKQKNGTVFTIKIDGEKVLFGICSISTDFEHSDRTLDTDNEFKSLIISSTLKDGVFDIE